MRALLTAILAAAAALLTPGGAHAGGSAWQFDRAQYQPGDVATGQAAPIAWHHHDALGRPDQGPYHAWLLPPDLPPSWTPAIPDGAVRVAEVEVRPGRMELAPGSLLRSHQARIRFVVPDLPPGTYGVLHCNDPCTTTLADITWGEIVIGPPLATEVTEGSDAIEEVGSTRRVPACVLEGLTRSRRWFPA